MLSNPTSDSTAGDVNCCIKAQDYFIVITALLLKRFKYRRCLSVKIKNNFYKIICLLYSICEINFISTLQCQLLDSF